MIKFKGITIDKKLEKFLRDNNAYEAFCENVNNQCGWDDEDENVLWDVDEGFSWDESPQGLDYWYDLQNKFDAL